MDDSRSQHTKIDASKDTLFNQWILNWVSKPNPVLLPNVGSTFRNFYGVYDIHGLVWEWTYDFNSALTTGESRGNSGLDNSLFCGGGSFASIEDKQLCIIYALCYTVELKSKILC